MWRSRMEGSNERFRRICVFCGSSSGNKTAFSDAALDLGKQLVHPLSPSGEDICWFLFESVTPTGFYPQNKRKGIKNSVHNCVVILAPKRDKVTCPRGTDWVERRIDLVYGGGSVGLMGLISQTVHDGGCHVLGVIPTALMPHEISGETVGEVKTVTDMHERKAEMARQADAFIALPGGYGTMEELLEMITWSQLGIHDKPVGLLNVDGYYNCLLALFDKGVEEGFIKPAARHIVVSAPTAKELILQMEEYVPMHDQVAPRTSWEIEQLGFSNDH